MQNLTYLGLMVGCVLCTLPLEFLLRARVWRRIRQTAVAVLPVAVVFVVWDILATAAGWWWFDPKFLLGVGFLGLPLEEWMFFVVVPVCAILTLEGVRRVKPEWGRRAGLADHPDDLPTDETVDGRGR